MKRILYILAIILSIIACTDDIDRSNRFTFTGETMADFLLKRSDTHSHFINLLKRANLFGLLSTYGQYTLFLPDNTSLEQFVAEQDSIYWTTKETEKPIWTGITSPFVDELTDSMANVIARMHLIERNYRMADFGEGSIGKWNFNDRALAISYKVVDERFYIMINNCSAIIGGDYDVENGVIHLIDKPINTKSVTVAMQIAEHGFFSIFHSAIAATGFGDAVSERQHLDSEEFKDKLQEYYNVGRNRYIKFTAFIEPNEVFNENGIYTLDDLKAFAEKWYGTEDRDNPKSPKNALYKFVAYHFVEGEIAYNRVVPSRSVAGETFDDYYIPGFDLYNYYVTMQNTIVKALKPMSTTDGHNIYLNWSKRKVPNNFEMRKHTNVRIIELTEFMTMDERYACFNPNAGNGIIHPIDKILIYNEDEMAGNILNERMRFDFTTMLFPELSSNNYWLNEMVEFPPYFFDKRVKHHVENSRINYLTGSGYLCDFMILSENYDFSFKLPPVPSRTYEVRISIEGHNQTGTAESKAKYQLYFDNKVCGNPILVVPDAYDPMIGWVNDSETLDNGVENDKQMRNRGWMKGPDCYMTNSYATGKVNARMNCSQLRKIIHKQHLTEGDHWLRFRYLGVPKGEENYAGRTYLIVDYIELVPLHIVNDPNKPEDRH
ncbi:MAG: fasciclin domain-containing protein [Bacteroidaceae bacterium]|nr:fasciclin domain-containing protein [Bacteroidaceae bacterium]